tara:strand:+ start:97 stop:315 length:219 start_codon:yes stop_codon:yes gene_type:complete
MYQPRTPNYRKNDPVMRWNLPDRVFFACATSQNPTDVTEKPNPLIHSRYFLHPVSATHQPVIAFLIARKHAL